MVGGVQGGGPQIFTLQKFKFLNAYLNRRIKEAFGRVYVRMTTLLEKVKCIGNKEGGNSYQRLKKTGRG